MVFIHLTTGIVGGCVLMFAVISFVANSAATVVVDEQEKVELKEEKRTSFWADNNWVDGITNS